jgi:hypothetical protein
MKKGASIVRNTAEYTSRMEQVYEKHMKIFTGGSLKEGRVGYAVITPESTITERMRQQTKTFNAGQGAVIKAIYFALTRSHHDGNERQPNDPKT